ncbi:MAG: hypothetical protein MAG453_02050 [Calditrichaeota bacterium]|nr:hypothetical protein [Calditrichota bacterium]
MRKYKDHAEAWSKWLKTDDERVEFEAQLFYDDVADMVLETMDRLGVSRAELARRMGVKRPQITKILSGEANLTLKSLYKLFRALDVDLEIRPVPGTTAPSQRARRHAVTTSPPS